MFSNLNWYEVVALLLLALFIFGDRLPKVIGEAVRMLRQLRRMANQATADLNRELGTDLRLEDLNPRTFIRRHVLSEEDQRRLVRPFEELSAELSAGLSEPPTSGRPRRPAPGARRPTGEVSGATGSDTLRRPRNPESPAKEPGTAGGASAHLRGLDDVT